MGVVSYVDEYELGELLNNFRRGKRLSPYHEFHFVNEKPETRAAFIAALAAAPIAAQIAVVDMSRASATTSWTMGKGDMLLARLIALCTTKMDRNAVENAVMLIDGNKGSLRFCNTVRALLSQELGAKGYSRGLKKVRISRSQRTPGIMVADMLTGAARHEVLHGQPYLAHVKKTVGVVSLP